MVDDPTTFSTRRIGFLGAALLLVSMSIVTMIDSVSAQAGPGATCTGDSVTTFGTDYFGFEDFGNRLLSTSPTSREFSLTEPLVAGTYALDAVAYDGYNRREETNAQPREQWYAELLSADGTVLATSGTTGDLEDGVVEATWSGALGEVVIDQTAVSVRTVHASPGSLSINSVRPVCLGATGGPVEPEPEPLPSTITVDYDSTNVAAADVMVVCGQLEESATGTAVDLKLTNVPGNAGCAVRHTSSATCTIAVTPANREEARADDGVNLRIPPAGGVDILVDIDCAGAVAAPTTTTPPVDTEVEGQVETPAAAPTAQVQPGTPAFTG